jgi:uncharacterized protein YbjT (DUF2867 family)
LKVLLTGASGFIGRHLVQALTLAGHEVVALVRRPDYRARSWIQGDFTRDTDAAVWVARLRGIEAVINAVGILRESRTQTFAALHAAAPKALFDACVAAGVRKVIQISALGADAGAGSRFHRSKAAADRHLAALALDWTILQPSLVFGAGGASTRFFLTLACAPLVPLPGRGSQRVQPVHVADVAALCVRLLETDRFHGRVIPVVGPCPYTLRELLAALRTGMGLGAARFVSVPMPAARAAARIAAWLPGVPLDAEALGMLERGNTAPADAVCAALGRAPQPVLPLALEERAGAPAALADWARLNMLLPLLRAAVALVWIATGVLSLGVYPVQSSYALLARVGLEGWLASAALYGAAVLDLALGLAVFVRRHRLWTWRLQMAVILAYTLIISVALPEYWLHPFGPVLKNLPLLAAIAVLHELERRA